MTPPRAPLPSTQLALAPCAPCASCDPPNPPAPACRVAGIALALGIPGSPLFVSPWALAFTAFVGANLLQYGFTNFCPLGWMLGKLGVPVTCTTAPARS